MINTNVCITFLCLLLKVILIDDFLGKEAHLEAHELRSPHRRAEVKVLQVHCEEARTQGGDDAIEEQFCRDQVAGRCATSHG